MKEARSIGRYRLGRALASGGMAQVFAAEPQGHGGFGRPIAIKQMLPHLADNPRFVSMFVREARLCSLLEHPNIVEVLDFEATKAGTFLVMEYIDGPNVLDVLRAAAQRRIRVPAPIACYITCHVLEALDYAHNLEVRGRRLTVIHRDVSPSNVLISSRGRVKLADFGIAHAADRQDSTAEGTLKGKYGYMAPEQVAGLELDPRSDLFSAAVVLAELLMGRRLFTAPNELELLIQVKSANLGRLDKHGSHIPDDLRAILERALARDPAERFGTAAELRDQLLAWMTRRPERADAAALLSLLETLELGPGARRPPPDQTISGDATRAARRAGVHPADRTRPSSFSPPVTAPFAEQPLTDACRPRARIGVAALPALERICWAAETGATGVLTVFDRARAKRVYFVDGHPDLVESNIIEERFGELLVREGVITSEQLERAVAMTDGGRHLARALVETRALRPIEAVEWLEHQSRDRLLELACWIRGNVHWEPDARAPRPDVALHLSTFALLGQLIWRFPTDQIERWYCRRHRAALKAATRPELSVADLAFAPDVGRLVATLDGRITVAELAERALPRQRHALLAALILLERFTLVTHG